LNPVEGRKRMDFSKAMKLCDDVHKKLNKRAGSDYSAGYFSALTAKLLSRFPTDLVIQQLNDKLGKQELNNEPDKGAAIMEDIVEINRLLNVFHRG